MIKKSILTSLVLSASLFSASAFADGHSKGDLEKGKKVCKKCAACHAVGEGAKKKVGPPLNDLIGRTAGTFEGMKYGKSLVKAGEAGLVWNAEELFAYLKNPKKYLRKKLDSKKAKSKMSLKLKKDKDRANVIAYIATFSKPAN